MGSTGSTNNQTSVNSKMDYATIKTAAMTLRAVNNKLRQKLLQVINENNRINVTDIYVKLRLEQSVASQQLAILRRANIVRTEREGKTIFYSLNPEHIADVSTFVMNIEHS
jgi:DNA-binding transcriptional ArsR family regulator